MKARKFRAGDRVLVRSPEEILSTLAVDGTMDNIPFMPEMLIFCGKPFRIQRRVEKTCVDLAPPAWGAKRRFPENDVVILDSPRCDGRDHNGCKHRCRIFWKEAWLSPMDADTTLTQNSDTGLKALRARLKVKSDETHFFCQSTELSKATDSFPGRHKFWWVRVPLREIRNGDRSAAEVLKLFVLWCWQKIRHTVNGETLRGPHKQTPSESLGLQPGELVRVKSRAQIVQTLDNNGRNRGMSPSPEMMRCCDGLAEVRYRVDRIIDERTGKMLEMRDTVTLQNMRGNETLCEECLCIDQLGDCPRGELMYWREIWLERVSSQ
jgi:hypothetical protein